MRIRLIILFLLLSNIPLIAKGNESVDDNNKESRYVQMSIIITSEDVQFQPGKVVKLKPGQGKDSLEIQIISSLEWAACFIDFPYGSPFDTAGTTIDGHLLLTGNRGRAAAGYHKFSLVCRDREGNIVVDVDPGVDNDTEPQPDYP